jgi:hypothetical protein
MTMSCADVRPLAAELALGLVAGPERAEALEHLDRCPDCRNHVESLATVGDELLLLTPSAEPTDGFETRVLAQLAPARPAPPARLPSRRVPRILAVAAAVLAAVTLAAGAFALRPDHHSAVAEATMWTASGKQVGDVYMHDGDPSWVFVAVPGWAKHAAGQQWIVRITLKDGKKVTLPAMTLDRGRGAWGSTVDVDVDDVRSVALLDPDGRLWCSATLSA